MGKRLSDDEKRFFTDQISMLKGENERLTKIVEDLEAELLKFRRLDITWGEEVKELDLTIVNLKEELEHLHSRFDRVLDDTFKEGR